MSEDRPVGLVRHLSIDAVGRFAVLGIPLMNVVGMGLRSFAGINGIYAGGAMGIDSGLGPSTSS